MIGAPGLLPTDVNPWTSVVTSLHINTPSPELNVKAKFKFFDNAEWEKLVSNGGRIGQLAARAGADERGMRGYVLAVLKHGAFWLFGKAPGSLACGSCSGVHDPHGAYSVERNVLLLACHWTMSWRMRFLSSLPTLVLGISVTRAI